MSEIPNAGTPPAEPVVSENAGTTGGAADGSEAGKKPVDFDLAMAWKAKAEEANRLVEEKKALEDRLREQEQRAQVPATVAVNPAEQLIVQKLQELNYRATVLGDGDAALTLGIIQQQQMLQQQQAASNAMAQVPMDRQSAVLKVMRDAQSRGEYITPKTAEMLIERESLSQKQAELTRRETELKAQQEAADRGVVTTRTVPLPAVDPSAKQMTTSQFSAAWDKATEAQRDDIYQRQKRGEIVVVPD